MLIYMCPLCVHIVAWDFSFRIRNMLGAAAFEGTPMQDWEPPTLTLYHYLLIVLIALHFTRRFAESLMLHVYSSGTFRCWQIDVRRCVSSDSRGASCRYQLHNRSDIGVAVLR